MKGDAYKTVGPTVGHCNICGRYGPLTVDHVPPKGCVIPRPGRVGSIINRGLVAGRQFPGTKVSHGLVFRTICESCNSGLLGRDCDPDLISASRQVAELLDSPLYLPASSTIRVRPQRVARAVLGHLMAVGLDRSKGGEFVEALRPYLLDQAQHLPDDLRFYYWGYLGNERVLVRDAGIMTLRSKGSSFFWLMKYYPLAFMAIWKGDLSLKGVRTFDAFRSFGFDEPADLMFDLHPLPHPHWPEAPGDYEAILYGRDALVAIDSPPRPRLLRKPA